MSLADGKWDKDAFPKQLYEDNPDRESHWWHKKTEYVKEFRTWSKQDLWGYANEHYNPYLESCQTPKVDAVMVEIFRRYGIIYG